MKKLVILFTLLVFCMQSVYAFEHLQLPYKNLKNKAKISYDSETDKWSVKIDKNLDFFVKTDLNGSETYYLYSDGNYAFSTGCAYEFVYNGKFIGYSNDDLKFYEMAYINGALIKKSLSKEEVSKLLKNYRIILISDFSPETNSIKIKKRWNNEKILILNDTDMSFKDYSFSSGNAKFVDYDLNGFINVTKSGMIQFSKLWDKTHSYPWFIILVR